MTADEEKLRAQLVQREAAMNDMFGRLQQRDAEIIGLSNERGRLHSKVDELERKIRKMETREAMSDAMLRAALIDNTVLRDSLRSAMPVILEHYGDEAAAEIERVTDPSGVAVTRFMEFLKELGDTSWARDFVAALHRPKTETSPGNGAAEITGVKEKIA